MIKIISSILLLFYRSDIKISLSNPMYKDYLFIGKKSEIFKEVTCAEDSFFNFFSPQFVPKVSGNTLGCDITQ